jgi:hypothetical protein
MVEVGRIECNYSADISAFAACAANAAQAAHRLMSAIRNRFRRPHKLMQAWLMRTAKPVSE